MPKVVPKFLAKWARSYAFYELVARHRRSYLLGLVSLFFVDALNVAMPLTVKVAVDALGPRNFGVVLSAGIFYLFLMSAQAIGRYLWRIYLIGSSHSIAQEQRLALYAHLQRLPLPYYQKVRTGDLMSRATNDIESVRMAVGPGILVTVDAVFIFLLMIPAMLWLSPKLTLLAMAFYPLVPWITKRLGTKIDELFESLQIKMSSLSSFTQESFGAIRLIKSLVLEPTVRSRFGTLSNDYLNEGTRLAKYQAVFSPSLSLLTNLGTFLILLVGGLSVMDGFLTLGTFIAFQRFVVQLSWPMEAIGWSVTMHREGTAALRRLEEVMTSPVVQSVRVNAEPVPEPVLLEVRDLKFSYAPNPTQMEGTSAFHLSLDGLKILSGEKVGIVGSVGSGKTTLFNLLVRLYEPPLGRVLLNGVDVASLPLAELRKRVVSVEQHIFLFSEKIVDNLFIGSGLTPDPDSARRVCLEAGVWSEIEKLPRGLDTMLGERGVNLSGGQKQRIALARALARNPEILLLDDSFSAVDVEVEDRVIDNLFRAYPSLTLLMASHRLSIMSRMDRIWVFEGGRVVEVGTHGELLGRSPLYRSLWEQARSEKERKTYSSWMESGGQL